MPTLYNYRRVGCPPGAVRIDRGTPYGNPFVVGRDGTREQCIARFEREILPTLDVSALRGKDLVCFCAPLPCHGNSIMAKANADHSA